MKKLIFLLLALPMLATAQSVPVPNSCLAGQPFTIRIPVRFPDSMTVQYAWYRNDTAVTAEATLPTVEKTIAYTVPANLAYGDNVEFHFKYCLDDECGNEWTKSPVYVVTFLPCTPPQASEITSNTAPDYVCAGNNFSTFSVTNVLGVTYNWTVPNDWTIKTGQGTNSIAVTVGASAGNANISVTPTTTATSCVGTTRTRTIMVRTTSLARPVINGPTAVCAGESDNSYGIANREAGVTYIWSGPSGWSIYGQGSTYSVEAVLSSAAVSGNLSVTGENECNASPPGTLAVTVSHASTLTRSSGGLASQTVCTEFSIASIVYTLGGSATSTSISWLPSAPAGISYSTSGTTGTISGTPTAAGVYTYTITTSGHTSPCTAATATGTITVYARHSMTLSSGSLSQTQVLCVGQAITPIVYTLGGGATGANVSWSPYQPEWIGSGMNANTLSVSGTASDIGVFYYTIETVGSSCPNVGATGAIVINGPPTPQPSAITGSTSVCPNAGLTYYVDALPGNIDYYWTLPSGWASNNSTLRSINVGAGTSGGTISVRAFNIDTNCYSPPRTLDVSIKTSGCP